MNLWRQGVQSTRILCTVKPSCRTFSGLGRKHHERRLIKFPAEHIFNIVSDVNQYKHFVPWCKGSRVITATENSMDAELKVGFGYLNEKYMSKVTMQRPLVVTAISTQTNLFEYLKTEWKFSPARDPSSTWVTFQIDFKFKSSIYNNLCDVFMTEVVDKMVRAFEQRCRVVKVCKVMQKPDS